MKNSRKLRCFRAAKVSRHDTLSVGRGCAVNSGGALAGVGVLVSSDGIDEMILTDHFVSIESQDENHVVQRSIYILMRVGIKSGNM